MTQHLSDSVDLPPMILSTGKTLLETLSPARLSSAKAPAILQEYRRFLKLAATGPGPTVPSPLIDAVWHEHLSDTRAYADWCDKALGRFIHHSPGREPQRDDPAYVATLARYEQTFGHPPDHRIWPSPARLRSQRWAAAVFFLAFASAVIGIVTETTQLIAIGFPLGLLSFAWLAFMGPWRFGTQSDGGCGGDSDGGCGGD
ncbi:MAG: hypothetical protein R3D60_05315 [Paracoccaceae bacterium]